jgi:hypothetical protein
MEQLVAEEAAREQLASPSLAVGPSSEKVLHMEGMMVDQTLSLDGAMEQ